ncbi:hypothetical protein [Peribacillus saganii]|nr:hypothetical protein [Peribacillus saganii]
MKLGDWYVKRQPKYRAWKNSWRGRINAENTMLYIIPSIVMLAAPVISNI